MKWKKCSGYTELRDAAEKLQAWIRRHSDGKAILIVHSDPRTGKRWRSIKATHEWFDEVRSIHPQEDDPKLVAALRKEKKKYKSLKKKYDELAWRMEGLEK
jgi:hypothetical protein